jgi:nitrogen fixation/metabolism regulation signal transduction histidine kinase
MTFKPRIWYPIAGVLSAVNLAAVAVAANTAEPLHATTHTALAVAFGLWAQRLRQRKSAEAMEPQERLDALEADMGDLRQELTEAQERLDFTERMLAQGREARRVGPERQD